MLLIFFSGRLPGTEGGLLFDPFVFFKQRDEHSAAALLVAGGGGRALPGHWAAAGPAGERPPGCRAAEEPSSPLWAAGRFVL